MVILGIDYGKNKMGLAISEGQLASPFRIIDISSLNEAINKILKIIEDEKVEKIVIGVPESGEAYSITKKFIFSLKLKAINVEIVETDETLTSQAARQKMVELNEPTSKRSREDAYSAAILLQDYLDGLSI